MIYYLIGLAFIYLVQNSCSTTPKKTSRSTQAFKNDIKENNPHSHQQPHKKYHIHIQVAVFKNNKEALELKKNIEENLLIEIEVEVEIKTIVINTKTAYRVRIISKFGFTKKEAQEIILQLGKINIFNSLIIPRKQSIDQQK